ncbi:MAG: cytochrome c3 family protein [Candidatus Binatia bacterium]
MKRVTGMRLLAIVLWIVVMSLTVWADTLPGSGIIGSPHDFTKVPGMVLPSAGAADACAFCHFDDGIGKPSPGIMSVLFSWSQRLSTQSFFWSNVTESGTQLPTNLTTWAGSSKICLGCHGDVVATNDTYQVASAAGGGAYTDDSGTAPLWARGAKVANRTGTGRFAAVVAKLDARRLKIAIGGDLNGTHPVGIPYPYQGVPGTYNGVTTGRHVDLRDFVPAPSAVKLFTTAGEKVVRGAQVGATGMECASCHDVHNEEVRDRWLLRDTQRQLCIDCHSM